MPVFTGTLDPVELAAQQRQGLQPQPAPSIRRVQPRSEVSKGLKQAQLSFGEAAKGLAGGLAQSVGADQFAAEQLARADEIRAFREQPELQPRVGRIEDVQNPQDFLDLLAFGGASSAPLIAGALAGRGVGGRLAGATGAGARGRTAAQLAGTAAPIETQNVGSLFQDIRNDPLAQGTPDEQFAAAVLGGTGQTATALLPLERGIRGLRSEVPGSNRLRRAGRGAAEGAALEGAQEAAEGVIGDVTRRQFNEAIDPFDPSRRLNEAVLGGALGGITGGVGGAVSRGQRIQVPERPPVASQIEEQNSLDLDTPIQPAIQGRIAKRVAAIQERGTSRGDEVDAFDLFDTIPDQAARTELNQAAVAAASSEVRFGVGTLTPDELELRQIVLNEPGGKDFWQELKNEGLDVEREDLGGTLERQVLEEDHELGIADDLADSDTGIPTDPFTGESDAQFLSTQVVGGAQRDILTNNQGRPWKFSTSIDPATGEAKGFSAAQKVADQFEDAQVVPYREMFASPEGIVDENALAADAELNGITDPSSVRVVARAQIPAALRGQDESEIGLPELSTELTTEQKRLNALVSRATRELNPALPAAVKEDLQTQFKKAKVRTEKIVVPVRQDGKVSKGTVPVTVDGEPEMLNLFNLRKQAGKSVPLDKNIPFQEGVAKQLAAGLASLQTSPDIDAQIDIENISDNTVVAETKRGTVTWGEVKKALEPEFISPRPAEEGVGGQLDPRDLREEVELDPDEGKFRVVEPRTPVLQPEEGGRVLPTTTRADETKGIDFPAAEFGTPIEELESRGQKKREFKNGLKFLTKDAREIETKQADRPIAEKVGNRWSVFSGITGETLVGGKIFANLNAAKKGYLDSVKLGVKKKTQASTTEGIGVEEITFEEFQVAQVPVPENSELDGLNTSQRKDMERRLGIEGGKNNLKQVRANLTKVGGEWMRRLGVKGEIKLIDTKEYMARKQKEHGKNWGERDPRATALGAVFGSDGAIYLSPTMSQKEQLEVLGHEIGHKVEKQLFKGLKEEDQAAIRNAYDTWYRNNFVIDKKLSDVLKARLPQFAGEALADSDITLGQVKGTDALYFTKFDEWFADQTSRWLTTDVAPRGVVDQFFSELAEKIKELIKAITRKRALPDAAVAEWLSTRFVSDSTHRARPEGPKGPEVLKPEPAVQLAIGKVAKDTKRTVKVAKAANQVSQNPQSEATNETLADAIRESEGRVPPAKPPSGKAPAKPEGDPLLTPKELNTLQRAFKSNIAMGQLRRLLADNEVALNEIETDPAKAMAYGYQFWSAGRLNIGPSTETVFQKIAELLRTILGRIHNSDQAETILRARADGTLARRSVGKADFVVQEKVNKTQLQRATRHVENLGQWIGPMLGAVVANASERVNALKNAELSQIMAELYNPVIRAGGRESFSSATISQRAKFETRLRGIFKGDGKDFIFGQAIVKIMQGDTQPKNEAERVAVKKLRKLLKNMYFYTQDAGMEFNQVENYFPRLADVEVLQTEKDAFVDMLTQPKYKKHVKDKAAAERIHDAYMKNFGDTQVTDDELQSQANRDGLDRAEMGIGAPQAGASQRREFSWISNADMAPFLSKDLGYTMSKYINTMVKRAEYTKRFGTPETSLETRFDKARALGATEKDIGVARDAVRSMLGRPEADIDPDIQKVQGYVMVAQNYAILGLATLSSLMDPVGMAIRGDMDTLWTGVKAGLDEAVAATKGNKTEIKELAELLGTTETKGTIEALGQEFGGYHLTGRAARWNEKLFKLNGLSDWTNSTRLMATAAAQKFVIKHAAGEPGGSRNSARFIEQLGIRPGDVTVKNGKIELLSEDQVFELEGELDTKTDTTVRDQIALQLEKDARVKAGLSRWVDEAILRPNAATRPIWASDPRWMLIFHMKSFTFAFQERIIKRILNEAFEGNWQPAVFSLGLLPIMFAADYMRDWLQGDEDERSDRTMLEALGHTANRAGLTGITQFGFDAIQDIKYGDSGLEELLGPTSNQAADFARDLFTGGNVDDDFVRALPLQNWWKKWDFLDVEESASLDQE